MGTPSHFGNLYALMWTLINFLLPFAVIALIVWYFKQKRAHQQEFMQRLDRIISLLERDKSGLH